MTQAAAQKTLLFSITHPPLSSRNLCHIRRKACRICTAIETKAPKSADFGALTPHTIFTFYFPGL